MKGIIVVDKPSNISSNKVVSIVKKLTGEKAGHMGTLDPLASGVLPVCIGKATRLFDYFLKKRKTYLAEFTFGYMTDTLDCEGKVVAEGGRIPDRDEIIKVCSNMLGEINQVPPMYSAKSVNGVRAYELARKGVRIDLKPKLINIYKFLLTEYNGARCAFEIECSSGTYIRSICRDLAVTMGTYATMTALRRVRSGPFSIEKSVSLDCLNIDTIIKNLINIDSVIDLDTIELDDVDYIRFLHGLKIATDEIGNYKIKHNDEVVAIAEAKDGIIHIKTNLN